MSARIIVTAGKGGVGKSTIAAATAAACADRGLRTLVMSIDSAHNLSDLLEVPLGWTPTPIAERLHGLEVDINRELETHWDTVLDFMRSMTAYNPGVSQMVAEECALLPGMEEVFGLMRLQAVAHTGEFDVVVLDAPPTGDMLKFLRLPDVVHWFMEKYHPLERGMIRKLRPVAEALDWPVPSDDYFEQVEQWYNRLAEASRTMTHSRSVSVRLVMNPDRVSLAESRRALSWTCLLGMNVDGLVVNKLLPAGEYPPLFASWARRQEAVMREVEESFSGLPVLRAELRPEEVTGAAALREFGRALFGDRDPAALWVEEPALQWREDGNGAELRIRLPFLKKGRFRLMAGTEGLTLDVENQRRIIPLPPAVRRRPVQGAEYDDGWLRVRYGLAASGGMPPGEDRAV